MPQAVLYGEFCRDRGTKGKCNKHQLRQQLYTADISEKGWDSRDRDRWRALTKEGTVAFEKTNKQSNKQSNKRKRHKM